MYSGHNKESILFFVGDVFFLYTALFITLLIRHVGLPSDYLLSLHLVPFSIIFAVWIFIFFVSDLYHHQTVVAKKQLSGTILNAQTINIAVAIAFFYLIPYFGITPRTTLFIYLFISSALIALWRLWFVNLVWVGRKEKALILGNGKEVDELVDEINNHPKYRLTLKKVSAEDIGNLKNLLKKEQTNTLILNIRGRETDAFERDFFHLLAFSVDFVDIHSLYEQIFERVPLSFLRDAWFLENVSVQTKRLYTVIKRLMDVLIGTMAGFISLALYPLVALLIKLDDGGQIFIWQERIGEKGQKISLVKFRSMSRNDQVVSKGNNDNKVTRIGRYLRTSRIDELPQLWNVLRGDLSLIGPRPEFPDAVEHYRKSIPYYDVRHMIKPGLSGWAQIYGEHSHHNTDIEKTKNKLSYDLYYLKNRNAITDIKIVLKTIKILLSRSGV